MRPLRPTWMFAPGLIGIVSGCYLSHSVEPPGDEGGTTDSSIVFDGGAAIDAPTRDAQLLDVPHCNGIAPHYGSLRCPPEGDKFCRAWAFQASLGRGAHSVCLNGGCTIGDYCEGPSCRCSETSICANGWACIDVDDGPPVCHYACVP